MTRRIVHLLVPLLLVVSACGKDDGADTQSASATGSGSGSVSAPEGECEVVDGVKGDADSEVHVSLTEYEVDIEESSAAAGIVKIEATNSGSVAHEVVVLAADPADIEVGDDGAVIEDGLIGEIEGFAAGTECIGSFELSAGTYSLLCAIVEESGESHYSEGMVSKLVVT